MKKRRGILFALGIVLTLSVAVPAVAAEKCNRYYCYTGFCRE